MGLGRDLRRAGSLDARIWGDLATAAAELAIARIRLSSQPIERLIAPEPPASAAKSDQDLIDRVAFAIPRIGERVPWRGTCLVQALAGQRWLARHGISSIVELGARKVGDTLDAHAWLKVGDRVVIGGDTSGHQPFQRPSTRARKPR